jgi:hemerythrin-like metal-binding protein
MSDAKNIFKWDKAQFTTYVDPMDKEHQVLIEIMNELAVLNEAQTTKSQLLKVAEKLGQKTKEHFAHEEQFMATVPGYKGLSTHKVIHASLLESFQKHVTDFQKSAENKLPDTFFRFLKVWLSAHICGIDRKYGELAKAQ